MIKIVAEWFVKPESREKFLELCEEIVEGTRAEEGNISYELHENIADPNHLTFIEEWKDQEYAFGRKYYDSTVAATPFKADAAWGVQKLKEMGHRIVIITGRTTDFYTDPYKTTIEELKNGKIVYDKLICTLEKGKACVAENIDILIDDVLANCEAAAKVGVKPIVFNSIANQNIKTEFPRAFSWKDVINMIAEKA